MEGNMKAFSFDSVLLKKINTPSLVDGGNNTVMPKIIKILDGFKCKTLQETQLFYRHMLECDNPVSAKALYTKLFDSLVKMNKIYSQKYLDALQLRIQSLPKYDSRIIDRVKQTLANYNSRDIILYEYDCHKFMLSDQVPHYHGVLTDLLKLTGNYYALSSTEADSLLDILASKQRDIIKEAKAEILGVEDYDYVRGMKVADLFMSTDVKATSLYSADINRAIEIVYGAKDALTNAYKEASKISAEYYDMFNIINKWRSNTKITLDNNDTVNKIERVLITMINTVCSFHLLVYATKIAVIEYQYKEAYAQICAVATLATDNDDAEVLEEANKAATESMKRQKLTFERLTDNSAMMNSIVNMKHNELIMDCCIKEALIIAEGVDVENRLAVLHEGVWAKVKEYFYKVKDYVVNLFTKVENWFDKFFKANSAYLEKYKDYLGKPTAGFDTVNMPNYEVGYARCKENKVPNFTMSIIDDSNHDLTDEDVEKFIYDYRKGLIGDFDKNVEFNEACMDYFKGGKDSEKDYAASNISITTLAEAVKSIPELVNNIKKDKNTSDQLFKSLEATINKTANKTEPAQQQNTKESTTYLYTDGIFKELEFGGKGSTPAASNTTTSSNGSAITTAGNKEIDKMKNTGAAVAKKAQKLINQMASSTSTYYQCKYQSAEKIMSDYMKIIKAHVSAYINSANNKEAESK